MDHNKWWKILKELRVPDHLAVAAAAASAKAFDCVDHNRLWKTLKEIGIPDHLTCLLQNLYAGQEATVRTRCGKIDWF